MKAQIINQFGAAQDVFAYTEIPQPDLPSDHVMVEVHATSVNPIDCKIRSGAIKDFAPKFPGILHSDVAGTVVAVGNSVSKFQVGDEVYGCGGGMMGTASGALATMMPVCASLLAHKPSTLDMRTAAALPLVGITAYTALVDKLNLQAKQDILIHGGAGGVGHVAVQIAKALGAQPYVTIGSEEDADFATSLGAVGYANFREEKVEDYCQRLTDNNGFSTIFDTVGGDNLQNSFKAIGLNGKIATTIARTTQNLSQLHDKGADLMTIFMLIPLIYNINRIHHQHILKQLARMADAGKLKPRVDEHHFTLQETAQAHELLESGQAKGKVVISVID